MLLSVNLFIGVGVIGFWGEFLFVVLIVCGLGLVCFDIVFGIFFFDLVVGFFLVFVCGGFILVYWMR